MAQHPTYNLKNLFRFESKSDLKLVWFPTLLNLAVLLLTWVFFFIDFPYLIMIPIIVAVYLNVKTIYSASRAKIALEIEPITEKEKKQSLEQIYFVYVVATSFIPPLLAFAIFNSDLTNGVQQNQLLGMLIALSVAALFPLATRLVMLDIVNQAHKQLQEEEELRKML